MRVAINLRNAFGVAAHPSKLGLAINLRDAFGVAARPSKLGLAIVVAVGLSLVVGCKKDKKASPTPSPQAPVSTTDQDALWALAPTGAQVGVVVSPRAHAYLEGGWLAIKKLFAAAPELAPFAAEMDAELAKTFGTTNVSAAELGMTTQKGFALFKMPEGAIVVVPVADRDKFLKLTKGTKGSDSDTIDDATCKTVQGVYACAKPVALLDQLGKKGMPDAMKLVGARGDIEVAGAVPAGPGLMPFAVAAQLDRGTVVVRAAVKGMPSIFLSKLAKASKPRVDPDKTTGFAVVDTGQLLMGIPPIPLVPGVMADELSRTVTGPLSISVEAGQQMLDLRIPLSDPALAQKLVDQCDTIPPLKMIGATVKAGVCHAAVPGMQLEVDAWIENKELRLGKKGGAPATVTAPLSPAGRELASGEWAFGFFGRGTLFATPQLPPMPLSNLPPEALMAIRAFSMLNELGIGMRIDGDTLRVFATVRTAWSNPDDVVAKLVALSPDQVLAGKTSAAAKAIADGAKGSPFSIDYAAGWAGLMIPSAAVGMLAAIAVPAFMSYMKKSKQVESTLYLHRIEKNLKVAYATSAQFPKGKVALSPSKPCCEMPDHKCSDPSAWQNPVWKSLDFEIDAHLFRYSYDSDGKTATVTAAGDLDCDGIEITYKLTATADAQGNVTTQLEEPAPNTD